MEARLFAHGWAQVCGFTVGRRLLTFLDLWVLVAGLCLTSVPCGSTGFLFVLSAVLGTFADRRRSRSS